MEREQLAFTFVAIMKTGVTMHININKTLSGLVELEILKIWVFFFLSLCFKIGLTS